MAEPKTKADSLGVYLSGAASNGAAQNDPALSLGDFRASKEVRGMGGLASGIPALVVQNTTASNGPGRGFINIDANQELIYTPPLGMAGAAVAIAAGETKFLEANDVCKGVRVFRSPDFSFAGEMKIDLVEGFNGVLSMGDIPDADRVAGETYYRAFFLYAHGPADLFNIKIWQGGAGPRQSILSFGKEVPIGNAIQTIANEKTAPIGVPFVTSDNKAGALDVGELFSGGLLGIWVRKTFPILGAGASREKVSVVFSFETEV